MIPQRARCRSARIVRRVTGQTDLTSSPSHLRKIVRTTVDFGRESLFGPCGKRDDQDPRNRQPPHLAPSSFTQRCCAPRGALAEAMRPDVSWARFRGCQAGPKLRSTRYANRGPIPVRFSRYCDIPCPGTGQFSSSDWGDLSMGRGGRGDCRPARATDPLPRGLESGLRLIE